MLYLCLILRDERGQVIHRWGFHPESVPVIGDYVELLMVRVGERVEGEVCKSIRGLVRSRVYRPSFCNGTVNDKPVDEYECEVTTDQVIEEGWYADSEIWTAQEWADTKRLQESGQ